MRRAPVVARVMVLTILVCVGPLSMTASAQHRQVPSAGGTRMTVTAQSPWVLSPGRFLLGVRIAGAPAATNIRVSVHRPLTSRAALGQTIATNDAGPELFNLGLLPIADQPSGRGDARQLSVNISTKQSGPTVQLDAHQVETATTRDQGIYPVQVRLLQRDGTILARLTTYLVRVPDNTAATERLRAALVIKLHVPLAVTDDGVATVNRAELGSVRTLVQAVRRHPRVPATLIPTPQSLESLRASRNAADTSLLDQVLAATRSRNQVLAPTYVRLDASAWIEAGLAEQLARQRLVGTNVLAEMISKADNRTWIADEDLTPAALGRLRDTGVQQLVVPERSLAPLDTATFPDSPTEPFKVPTDTGIPTPAVQIDSRLQLAFTRTADPVLGAHELLAELALTSFEQHSALGGVVLAPPDGWRASPVFLKVLLDGLAPANPVVAAATVDRLFATVPPAGSTGPAALRKGDRGVDLVRPLTAKPTPSLGPFPDNLRSSSMRLASYGSMVGPTSARLLPFQRRLDLAGSADLSIDVQNRLFALVNADLDRLFKRISTPPQEKVTLTARDAKFPLTLQSRFGYPVNVVVDLQASNRLTFPLGNRIQVRVVGQRARVPLRVRAPVSGDTPLQVTVLSADGNVVLARSSYTVRSTAVSGVGIVLTIGAALFLVIWWIRHWRSSARSRRNGPSTI